VALDPRLADLQFLTIAALRARQRRADPPPGRTVTLQVVYYDARGLEPDELGERYTYELPPHRHGVGGGA
jgi:hypothetical protein